LTKDRIAPAHESLNRLQPETISLNGFNIKRFEHPYCLRVLFLWMCCHWLKRDAETLWPSHAAVTRILLLELTKISFKSADFS